MKKERRYSMSDGEILEKLLDIIDGRSGELIDFCLEIGNIPSPHGKEKKVAVKVSDYLRHNGIHTFFQWITEESANVVGVIPGTGAGSSLILNAHMDTGEELALDASESEKRIEGAWKEGDLIFGKGVINDKAQLCALLFAVSAIKNAGIRLKGDLMITGVAFETGSPSVDNHQGINFPGEGFGTKWLVDRGVVADYALVAETSGFGIIRAECGAVWLKICVLGRQIYTPRLKRGLSPNDNQNSFYKAARLVTALEDWAVHYEKREQMHFEGGTIIPKAQVVDIHGDRGHCDIYLDVRILPEKNPLSIKKEVYRTAKELGIECEISIYQYSRGHIARNAEPLVVALEEAHRQVFGQDPPLPPPEEVSMWRDLNVFNEVGIPAVCYGPPRRKEEWSGAQNRAMKIPDLVSAAKVYALAILSICGGE
jgi:acetylornithine deacetylase/succinyl-diaminopimelate desuccinylase-like protein